MLNRKLFVAVTLASSVLAAGGALAQSKPIVGIGLVNAHSEDARITAIDPNACTVTLALDNGTVVTRKVSPALADFAALNVGETVSAGFADKLATCCPRPTPSRRAIVR